MGAPRTSCSRTPTGYFDTDASPESYRDHFDEVMADDDPLDTSGFAEFARYATLLPDPGPFA